MINLHKRVGLKVLTVKLAHFALVLESTYCILQYRDGSTVERELKENVIAIKNISIHTVHMFMEQLLVASVKNTAVHVEKCHIDEVC